MLPEVTCAGMADAVVAAVTPWAAADGPAECPFAVADVCGLTCVDAGAALLSRYSPSELRLPADPPIDPLRETSD